MRFWHRVEEFKKGPFDVVVEWTDEDTHPSDHFDNGVDPDTGKPYYDIDQIAEDIDCGRLDWFVAGVRFFYDGHEVGSDYLGGNLYEDVDEAFETGLGGFLDDMVQQAEAEALDNMGRLMSKIKLDFPRVWAGVKA